MKCLIFAEMIHSNIIIHLKQTLVGCYLKSKSLEWQTLNVDFTSKCKKNKSQSVMEIIAIIIHCEHSSSVSTRYYIICIISCSGKNCPCHKTKKKNRNLILSFLGICQLIQSKIISYTLKVCAAEISSILNVKHNAFVLNYING